MPLPGLDKRPVENSKLTAQFRQCYFIYLCMGAGAECAECVGEGVALEFKHRGSLVQARQALYHLAIPLFTSL